MYLLFVSFFSIRDFELLVNAMRSQTLVNIAEQYDRPFEYGMKGKLEAYHLEDTISGLKLAFLAFCQTIPAV